MGINAQIDLTDCLFYLLALLRTIPELIHVFRFQ